MNTDSFTVVNYKGRILRIATNEHEDERIASKRAWNVIVNAFGASDLPRCINDANKKIYNEKYNCSYSK